MDVARPEVESQAQLKMSCLYVDHGGGELHRPSDARVDAAGLVSNGQAKSAFLHTMLDRVTPETVLTISEHGDVLENFFFDQLIDETDAGTTVARLRALIAAAAVDDIEALTALVRAAVGSDQAGP